MPELTTLEEKLASVLFVVLALAGCGGAPEESAPEPTLPAPVAVGLAERADGVADLLAAGDTCAAAAEADELLDETIRAVRAGDVPPELQEELVTGANELVHRIECTPAQTETEPDDDDDDDGEGDDDDGNRGNGGNGGGYGGGGSGRG
jgi:hypothetical protein